MFVKRMVLIALLLAGSEMVLADCTYNGSSYPSGTTLGPYVCDGTEWVIKK